MLIVHGAPAVHPEPGLVPVAVQNGVGSEHAPSSAVVSQPAAASVHASVVQV